MAAYILIGLLALANVFVLPLAFPDRRLSVSFFDVGQGDSMLIEGPTGVQVLIDGGADASALRGVGTRLPFFDRSLDAVVATHPDQDHIGGLPDVVERYRIGTFLEPGVLRNTPASRALRSALEHEAGLEVLRARRGMRLMLGGGAYADVLFPDVDVSDFEPNAASIVMRVVYGETEFLLTGDAPASIERYMVALYGNTLESDVLKVGHHGSKTSSSEAFVSAVDPTHAVISAGEDNRYGHPHQEVLDTLNKAGAIIVRTDKAGTITFVSDGRTITAD